MGFGIQFRENDRFKPHMNHALGKFIHTKDDYLSEMKKNNLIPQKEANKIAEAKRREMDKPRKTSAWAHEMAEVIKRTNGKPGGAFYDQLAKRGYDVKKMASAKKQYDKHFSDGKGGMKND